MIQEKVLSFHENLRLPTNRLRCSKLTDIKYSSQKLRNRKKTEPKIQQTQERTGLVTVKISPSEMVNSSLAGSPSKL